MPEHVLCEVIKHTSDQGWQQCVFTDDSFANRRIYPGAVFKHSKVAWKVTDRSMHLHIVMTINDHLSKAAWARRKASKKELEDGAEFSALAEAIYLDAVGKLGLQPEELDEEFIGVLRACKDPQLHLEVASIQSEKPEQLVPDRISVIKALITKKALANINSNPMITMRSDNLEESAFGIVKSSIEHDVQSVLVYVKKYTTYENALYWAKHQWQKQKQASCRSAAGALFQMHTHMAAFSTADDTVKEFLSYLREVIQKPSLGLTASKLASAKVSSVS
jgi:hypothetical protein